MRRKLGGRRAVAREVAKGRPNKGTGARKASVRDAAATRRRRGGVSSLSRRTRYAEVRETGRWRVEQESHLTRDQAHVWLQYRSIGRTGAGWNKGGEEEGQQRRRRPRKPRCKAANDLSCRRTLPHPPLRDVHEG